MNVQFAAITADPLKLDKRPDFTAAEPVTIAVQISQPCNMENPHFLLNVSGVFSYNYCYVPLWGKYYFLGEPTFLNGNQLTVNGTCDVLTTNADAIKMLSINVTRSDKRNTKMMDNLQPSQVNRQSEIITLKNSFSPAAVGDIRYVLTVQGGAHL